MLAAKMSRPPLGTSTPHKAAKAMSSRLSNMKFMQRAAAGTPLTQSPGSGSEPPSAKRTRTPHNASQIQLSTPATPTEQGSQSQAFTLHGTETMWKLSGAPDDKQEDELSNQSDDEPPPWEVSGWQSGRMAFGGFKNKGQMRADTRGSEEEEVDDNEDNDQSGSRPESNSDPGESTGAREFAKANLARVRAAMSDKRRAERDKAAERNKDRKKKEVKLNKTQSGRVSKSGRKGISSGGG